MRLHKLAAAVLCLSILPSAVSAYQLCTNATLLYGTKPDLNANIEIGGAAYGVTLQFGKGPICDVQPTTFGTIRDQAAMQPDWQTCNGEVPVGSPVGATGGAGPVTINVTVQYTSENMQSPYYVINCSKE